MLITSIPIFVHISSKLNPYQTSFYFSTDCCFIDHGGCQTSGIVTVIRHSKKLGFQYFAVICMDTIFHKTEIRKRFGTIV